MLVASLQTPYVSRTVFADAQRNGHLVVTAEPLDVRHAGPAVGKDAGPGDGSGGSAGDGGV